MNTQNIFLLLLIIFATIGLFQIIRQVRIINAEKAYVVMYLEHFLTFVNDRNHGSDQYFWLINQAPKIQEILGSFGIGDFQPPYQRVIHRNMPLLRNFIPEILKYQQSGGLVQQRRTMEQVVIDTLNSFDGVLSMRLDKVKKRLLNPVIWLIEGFKSLLLLPLTLLSWSSVIEPRTVEKAATNTLINVLSLLVASFNVFGTIVTVTTGWSSFKQLLLKFLF